MTAVAELLAALAALAALLALVELAPALAGRGRGLRASNAVRGRRAIRMLAARVASAARAVPLFGGAGRPVPVAARLAAAGEGAPLDPGRWLRFKLACAVSASCIGLPAAASAPGRLAALLLPGAALAGFTAPELWLARRSRHRIAEALEQLPDMLDLLRVTVAAGMAPARALGEVGSQFAGTLGTEWRAVATEVALGAPQDETVRTLANRLPAEEIAALVDALTRTRRHGVPLSAVLAALASRARHRLAQQLRERAARAGPKIQLVVALLLVPSVLLVVVAALIAELEAGGLFPA
jgi:tight adherence protein C